MYIAAMSSAFSYQQILEVYYKFKVKAHNSLMQELQTCEYTGCPWELQGIKSSINKTVHFPSLQSRTWYTPSLQICNKNIRLFNLYP